MSEPAMWDDTLLRRADVTDALKALLLSEDPVADPYGHWNSALYDAITTVHDMPPTDTTEETNR